MSETERLTKRDKVDLTFIIGFALGKGLCGVMRHEIITELLKKLEWKEDEKKEN